MNSFIIRHFIMAVGVLVFTGCASRSVAIAPSTMPLSAGTRGTENVSGDSCHYALLGILPMGTNSSTSNALKEVLEENKAIALTDVTVDQTFSQFILFTRSCITVSGRAVKIVPGIVKEW